MKGIMKPNYTLISETRNKQRSEIYYKFRHMENGTLLYYKTTIGDGFVRSEPIKFPEYVASIAITGPE